MTGKFEFVIKKIKNKHGTDKMLSVYWFFILVLIAGGVFAMAYNYYGSPYDVRAVEADLFANKMANCISNQGKINPDFFVDKNLNSVIQDSIIEECKLNLAVEEEYSDNSLPQYFFEVEFYKIEDLSKSALTLSGGNLNFKADCLINPEDNKKYSKLAKCTERRFYSVSEEGNQYLIKILSAVGKNEKNIKI